MARLGRELNRKAWTDAPKSNSPSPPMPYPNPSYVDNLAAAVDVTTYCYNNGKTYMTYNGNPSPGAQQTILTNSDKQMIGSVTYIDGRKGTLALQYALQTDELAGAASLLLPTYILAFRGRFYVTDAVSVPIVKNDVIKLSAAVTELQTPFAALLLSVLGQQKVETFVSGGSHTISGAATGARAGSTLVYSLETFATPGSAAPTGFSVNSSSGLITVGSGVLAGTYDVRLVIADTITKPDGTTDTVYGMGRYTPTLT